MHNHNFSKSQNGKQPRYSRTTLRQRIACTSKQRQSGFTIIELMIATLVFSTILLVITVGVLTFTSAYYKGINSSTTQNTARSVMDTVSQSVQFSGYNITNSKVDTGVGSNNTGTTYFCTNNQIYIYRPGVQYMGAAATLSNPGLYEMNNTSTGCAVPNALSGGKQLIAKHMRLVSLTVSPDSNVSQSYSIAIRLAYSSGGDPAHDGDDLLCSPSIDTGAGSCVRGSANLTDFTKSDITCKSQTGSQFCAVSALTTTVVKRVDNS